jgi:xanthine dehydrogenase iron-sulfur cluster and FAD-binding subunit A
VGNSIREELSGNLCRCTEHVGIVKAIQSVGTMQEAGELPDTARSPEQSREIGRINLTGLMYFLRKSSNQMKRS